MLSTKVTSFEDVCSTVSSIARNFELQPEQRIKLIAKYLHELGLEEKDFQ